MGGFGAWDLMMRHNDYFAAGILVCGGGDLSQAEALKDTPLFVFHGDADPTVPVSGSRDVVQAIRDAGGELVQYVEYAGQGHGIWNTAFAHPGMLQELLSYKLSTRYPVEESVTEPITSVEESVTEPITSVETSLPEDEESTMGWIIAVAAVAIAVAAVLGAAVLKKKK
jgi:acetyl esterase/lipase